MRIEDPCAGDAYRPWDGFAIGGPAGQGASGGFIVDRGVLQGLATLDLAIDAEGYILAQRPDTNPYSNGIAGEGRKFSADQLQKSNLNMISGASSYVGYDLPFVSAIPPDYRLGYIREPYEFADIYDVNSDESQSQVLEATYLTLLGYEGITITSAPSDRFQSLALDKLTNTVDGVAIPDMNKTALRALLGIYGEIDDEYKGSADCMEGHIQP